MAAGGWVGVKENFSKLEHDVRCANLSLLVIMSGGKTALSSRVYARTETWYSTVVCLIFSLSAVQHGRAGSVDVKEYLDNILAKDKEIADLKAEVTDLHDCSRLARKGLDAVLSQSRLEEFSNM